MELAEDFGIYWRHNKIVKACKSNAKRGFVKVSLTTKWLEHTPALPTAGGRSFLDILIYFDDPKGQR